MARQASRAHCSTSKEPADNTRSRWPRYRFSLAIPTSPNASLVTVADPVFPWFLNTSPVRSTSSVAEKSAATMGEDRENMIV